MESENRKAAWRRTVRAARSRAGADDGSAFAAALFGALPQAPLRAISGYAPLPGEPNIGPALDAAARRGIEVWLPVTILGEPLWWARWDPAAFPLSGHVPDTELSRVLGPRMRAHRTADDARDAAGSVELIDSPTLAERVDLLLVPALAVDARGFRMGQGGGFYDRSFGPCGAAPLTSTRGWACVRDEEILATGGFPVSDHDLRCHAALTPSGLVSLAADEG